MKLKCFPITARPCELRPGRPDRDWMDGFMAKQPYRCLPLTIANTTGWELVVSTSFRARWDGDEKHHVQFDARSTADAALLSQSVGSHFGGGVITFFTGYLFRSEPEWDLWVGGPPNLLKHGAQPLTGIVETSWLPQHFTMNWRFTAPGEVIFEAGEPFGFITPVPHRAVDECELIIKDLAKEPELAAQNAAWRKSRDEFIAGAPERDLSDPSQLWQGFYFKGMYSDGSAAPPGHVARRRASAPRAARDDE